MALRVEVGPLGWGWPFFLGVEVGASGCCWPFGSELALPFRVWSWSFLLGWPFFLAVGVGSLCRGWRFLLGVGVGQICVVIVFIIITINAIIQWYPRVEEKQGLALRVGVGFSFLVWGGWPVAATFWVNASRVIPPLTIGNVKNSKGQKRKKVKK